MSITVVNLFKEDLTKKIGDVSQAAKQFIERQKISHESTDEQLKQVVDSVIKDVWNFDLSGVEFIEVDKKTELISLDAQTAAKLSLPFSISRNTVESLKVTYFFNIEGDDKLLEYSRGGYSILTFTGNQSKNKLELHYYLIASPAEETIDYVKNDRNGKLANFKAIYDANVQYLKEEKTNLWVTIHGIASEIREKKRRENDLKNRF